MSFFGHGKSGANANVDLTTNGLGQSAEPAKWAKMGQKYGPAKEPAEQVVKGIRRATKRQFSAEEQTQTSVSAPVITSSWWLQF